MSLTFHPSKTAIQAVESSLCFNRFSQRSGSKENIFYRKFPIFWKSWHVGIHRRLFIVHESCKLTNKVEDTPR